MDTTQLGPLTVSRLCLGTMLMGGAKPPRGVPPDVRPVRGGSRDLPRTSPTSTATAPSRRADARPVAGGPPGRGGGGDEVLRVKVCDPADQGLWPNRSAPPATPAWSGSASTSSTSTRSTRPIPRRRWRTSLEALDGLVRAGKVRALGASISPPGCSRGRSRCRTRKLVSPFVSLQPRSTRWSSARVDRAAAVLPRGRDRRDPVGPARRRLPHRAGSRARSTDPPEGSRMRRRGRRDRGGPATAARSSATSASSTRPRRSPPPTVPRSPRSRSRGSASTASPHQSWGRARTSTSRTCSAPSASRSQRGARAARAPPRRPRCPSRWRAARARHRWRRCGAKPRSTDSRGASTPWAAEEADRRARPGNRRMDGRPIVSDSAHGARHPR